MDEERELFNENISAILNDKKKRQETAEFIDDNIRQRSKKRMLRVSFANNKVICYKNATITFTEILKRIGLEEVQKLNLEVAHIPLVGKHFFPKYARWMKPVGDGWYVMIQSDTDQKLRQLLSIKQQLNWDIKVEIGTDFETDSTKLFQKSAKVKSDLLVKFPNGDYVGSENVLRTYVDALTKIGLDKLFIKNLNVAGKPLFTKEKRYNGQVQLENSSWLTVPPLTKIKLRH